MWPPDRSRSEEVLRIGRHAVERWGGGAGDFRLVASKPLSLDAFDRLSALRDAVQSLYATPTRVPVTAVLESAWVPIVAVETGSAALTGRQLDALVRHRFRLHHDDPGAKVAEWDLRIAYRAGQRLALAHALEPALKTALVDAGTAAAIRWRAWSPAFEWGWHRLRRTRGRRLDLWWVSVEQDRSLVARFGGAELRSLHPGAAHVSDQTGLPALIGTEEARAGFVPGLAPIVAVAWDEAPAPSSDDGRATWMSFAQPAVLRAAVHRSLSQVPA